LPGSDSGSLRTGPHAPRRVRPIYDTINGLELDPTENEPLPYGPYREMQAYLHEAPRPTAWACSCTSKRYAADLLLQGPRTLHRIEDKQGRRMMQRDADNPEGPFRPITNEERARHAQQQETAFMEAMVLLPDFNQEMERLGEPKAEIFEF
jgi:hypothetical protein